MSQPEIFSISVFQSGSIMAALISGELNVENKRQFDQFSDRVLKDISLRAVVIDFAGVGHITQDFLPHLIQFQTRCRKQMLIIRLTAIDPSLSVQLLSLGAILQPELSVDLRQGLLGLNSAAPAETESLLKQAG